MEFDNSELDGIFKQIEEHTYKEDCCFLCGIKLDESNRTEEHVIPKWLQKRFNLWNERLILINGSEIQYRFLTIPCCFDCNNKYLNPFETEVLTAFNLGFEAFKNLDPEILFFWLGKFFFGIMYKELFLEHDRKNPEKGTIITPEFIRQYYVHFLFLQGIRGKHRFKDFFPASIYIYNTQMPPNIEDQWDLKDNIEKLFISIRMGEIGIIAALQDGAAVKQCYIPKIDCENLKLHPQQFKELTALYLYHTYAMNRVPKFITNQINGVAETVMLSLQGLSDKPIFEEWDVDFYTEILAHITGRTKEECQPEPGKYWTILNDAQGDPIFLDINKYR